MLSSAGSLILRIGAWSYLPDFATRKLLSFYYQLVSSREVVPPPLGSPRWQRHYRIAYSISVLAFLSYNLIEAARSTPVNFYQVLGVSPEADEMMVRSSYRAFAKRYHPDRAGPASEPMFMAVRDAYEALKDPMKRFAYERFGPDALDWRNCSAPMDYLKQGIMQSSGFYIVSGAILVVISFASKPSSMSFWRYILLLCLLACELCLTAGPRSFGLLGMLFPNHVAFQHVLFLHQLFVFFSVALSRVIPVLFAEPALIRPEDPATYEPWLRKLDALERLVDNEILRLLHTELHASSYDSTTSRSHDFVDVVSDNLTPCNPPPETLEMLMHEMEDILVEQYVRNEPPLRALCDAAVRKARERESPLAEPSPNSNKDCETEDIPDSGYPNGQPCLPSPAPSETNIPSPSVGTDGEQELQQRQDNGCATPVCSPPSPESPTVLLDAEAGLTLRTSGGRPFIRIVEQSHPSSPH